MKVITGDIKDITKIPELKSSVTVIGNFDGLHTYHQKLLWDAEKIASEKNLQLVVITFDKSFNEYYGQDNNWLLKNDDKQAFFENYFAVDYYIVLKVNKDLEKTTPTKFVKWLKDVTKTKMLVEGSDFTYGPKDKANIASLQKAFGEENVKVWKRRASVSSTKIRECFEQGKVDRANKMLFKHLMVYVSKSNDDIYHIDFPNITFKPGYYDVLLDGTIKGRIVIGSKNSVSIVDSEAPVNQNVKTMIIDKYDGATLS